MMGRTPAAWLARHIMPVLMIAMAGLIGAIGPSAALDRPAANAVLFNWNRMVLELVRHTPTYSPPVASRAFAYLGVTAYEAAAGGSTRLRSFAGQLNALSDVPARDPDARYDEAVVMHAAMAIGAERFFGNTGPTGQRAMTAMNARMSEMTAAGLPEDVVERSRAHGRAVAEHIVEWSLSDGGATVENLGFPETYALGGGPQHWTPTSTAGLQQKPLLPSWGENRPFAMPDGAACPLPPPPAYSREPGSPFHDEAMAVYEATRGLTDEHKAIARFWSDDPMLSPTPPGHWVSIALDLLRQADAGTEESADLFARLGITLADAFIGCWHEKYAFDLVRPITYIRQVIDPDWQPLLITPPFPEYPSGHSTQSGAAASVLTRHFGADFAFTDTTHEKDGLGVRRFENFDAAAEEAALSRLYGGIHFPAAIERGLEQGHCIAAHTNALVTRR